MSYYDDDDDDRDLYDEDEFGEEDGFSELDFDEESDDSEDDAYEEYEKADPNEPAPPSEEPSLEELLASAGLSGGSGQDDLAWRETYHVMFTRNDRPTLTQVEAAIGETGKLEMEHLQADDDGLFLSVLVHAPEDNASLEISYEQGDAVTEQTAELAKLLKRSLDTDQLAQLLRADARFDVMHFERVDENAPFVAAQEDIALEALNPATLIAVVEALANLTGGLPIDPAAGDVMI